MTEGKGTCISYFMCCWDKIPVKSNWTKERLFLADSSRAQSFIVGSHGRRRWGSGHIASTARQQRAVEAGGRSGVEAPFLFFTQLQSSAYGMMPPTFRVGSSTSTQPRNSFICLWRFLSMDILHHYQVNYQLSMSTIIRLLFLDWKVIRQLIVTENLLCILHASS